MLWFCFRGVIVVSNESYGIEPAPQFTANEHLLYHLKHSHSEAFACGVAHEDSHNESHYVFDPAMSLTALIRVGMLIIPFTVIIEPFLL